MLIIRSQHNFSGSLNTLREKHAPTVARMLLYFYKGDYPDTGSDLSTSLWPHITMFALADHLGLEELRDFAITRFEAVAGWDSAVFVDVVDTVYSMPSTTDELRNAAVVACMPHYAEIAEADEWKALLEDWGTFTRQLLRFAAMKRNERK